MNKPFVIGIAGGSGSGKTFFLNCFLSQFDTGDVCLISQDDYYRARAEQPVDENGWINYDLPQCIDDGKLLSDLKQLIDGNPVEILEYTFEVAEPKTKIIQLRPAPIIIVEGLFIFHYPEIAGLLNLRIFMDAEEEITLNRRLKRDISERGLSTDAVMYQWKNHVLPAYNSFLLPYKHTADRLIMNNAHVADDIILASKEISDELKVSVLGSR